MKYILIILVLLFCVKMTQAQDLSEVINKWKIEELTTENVALAIMDLQIENPVIVFKQTIKESGWKNSKTEYKSKLALVGNNLFGMRKARKRLTTALDKEYCGYATYSHWIYSVLDYKYWQESKPRKKGESYKKYLVRRGYARNTKAYVKNFNQYILPEDITEILENENREEHNRYYTEHVAEGQLPLVCDIVISDNWFGLSIRIDVSDMAWSYPDVCSIRCFGASLFSEETESRGAGEGIYCRLPEHTNNVPSSNDGYVMLN